MSTPPEECEIPAPGGVAGGQAIPQRDQVAPAPPLDLPDSSGAAAPTLGDQEVAHPPEPTFETSADEEAGSTAAPPPGDQEVDIPAEPTSQASADEESGNTAAPTPGDQETAHPPEPTSETSADEESGSTAAPPSVDLEVDISAEPTSQTSADEEAGSTAAPPLGDQEVAIPAEPTSQTSADEEVGSTAAPTPGDQEVVHPGEWKSADEEASSTEAPTLVDQETARPPEPTSETAANEESGSTAAPTCASQDAEPPDLSAGTRVGEETHLGAPVLGGVLREARSSGITDDVLEGIVLQKPRRALPSLVPFLVLAVLTVAGFIPFLLSSRGVDLEVHVAGPPEARVRILSEKGEVVGEETMRGKGAIRLSGGAFKIVAEAPGFRNADIPLTPDHRAGRAPLSLTMVTELARVPLEFRGDFPVQEVQVTMEAPGAQPVVSRLEGAVGSVQAPWGAEVKLTLLASGYRRLIHGVAVPESGEVPVEVLSLVPGRVKLDVSGVANRDELLFVSLVDGGQTLRRVLYSGPVDISAPLDRNLQLVLDSPWCEPLTLPFRLTQERPEIRRAPRLKRFPRLTVVSGPRGEIVVDGEPALAVRAVGGTYQVPLPFPAGSLHRVQVRRLPASSQVREFRVGPRDVELFLPLVPGSGPQPRPSPSAKPRPSPTARPTLTPDPTPTVPPASPTPRPTPPTPRPTSKPTPRPTPSSTPVVRPTATATPPTPTPQPSAESTPVPSETPTPEPTPSPVATARPEPTARPAPRPLKPSPVPTPRTPGPPWQPKRGDD